ncbi:hypothetical protein KKA69_05535 [Patescibacteria group bacterium]|nr:hypothetical protein [Patescibacteria group bacterium]
MLKKIIKFIKSFSTPLLLTVIALILFFGLFKNEIQIWKFLNWPSYIEREISYDDKCTKKESNPEYWTRYGEILKECPYKINSKYELNEKEREECIETKKKEITSPSFVDKEYICKQTRKETWFYAFGRYWFKK